MRHHFAAVALALAAQVILPALADDKKEEKAGPSLLFTEQDRVELANTEGMLEVLIRTRGKSVERHGKILNANS